MASRILVVEDDPQLVAWLGGLLGEFGYELAGAVSKPEEALPLIRQLHPDLVLMDLFFEGVPRGVDLAWLIHDETNVPVVFLGGGDTDPSLLLRIVNKDPVGFVSKPIDPAYLQAVLQRALRGSARVASVTSGD